MTATESIEERMNRLHGQIKDVAGRWREWAATQPQFSTCDAHGEATGIDETKSINESLARKDFQLFYIPCPVCVAERRLNGKNRILHQWGVPANMCHCRFENFRPVDDREKKDFESVQEFCKKKRGILVLLGTVGKGKTHLAVSAMRCFKSGLFRTQSQLLDALRESYHDPKAKRVIGYAKSSAILVLDEMGLSAGGRDEYPMLHDVLSHRYGELKPTILTGNITRQQLMEILGERLVDRLKESTYKVIELSGASHRATSEARQQYLED